MIFDNQPPNRPWYRHGRHVRPVRIRRRFWKLKRWALISAKTTYAERHRQHLKVLGVISNSMGPLLESYCTPPAQTIIDASAAISDIAVALLENPRCFAATIEHGEYVTRALQDLVSELRHPKKQA